MSDALLTVASPVAMIELAMLKRLREVARGYTGLSIESYSGQLDDEMFAWARTLPACWVTFDGEIERKRVGRLSYLVKARFLVFSAQRSLSESQGRLAGAAAGASVGVYQLAEDNKAALASQTLGLAMQPLEPGVLVPVLKGLVNREGVAVYSQQMLAQWEETMPDPRDDVLGELHSVGLNYLLKPGDSTPDSSDLVTLASVTP